ncbi:MAG TPA: protein kinase [Thermoanaerobaculia bacterium]|jgi:serine/threonine-protein kinase
MAHCIHCRSEIDPKYKACPFCGEAITEFMRRYADTPLDGKYQILSRLGVGGMGEVYKALHIHLNALRVIKLMRSAVKNDHGAHERFLREARLATRIHHPNVAALFDFATLDDGARYMVSEYIEGINLHELINERGPLSPRYAATLAIQALMGLEAIHRAGIVHRDVSPENLMVTRDDEGNEVVKVIDLGIAKQGSDTTENKTKTGMFVGKWKYCSPEHLGIMNEGERIDGRADVYSFGIVLYEMLTGVPPFQADTPHRYLMMHASQQPKPLRDTNATTTASPELEALIFRALEKDRSKRFPSARDFAKAIEALLPTLSDTAGALPVLPTANELTIEPTQPAVDVHAPTQPELKTTVRSMDRQIVHMVDDAPPPQPRASSSRWPWLAVAAAAVIAVGAWLYWPKKTAPAPAPRPLAAVARARLGINAFPWGEATIRNVANSEMVSVVTPAPVDLAPGTYEITLKNPKYPQPLRKTVSLRPGEEQAVNVSFVDPASVSLPRFDGAAQ